MDSEPKPMPCISPEIIALASKTCELDLWKNRPTYAAALRAAKEPEA
jgi:hypothetical protein